MLAPKADTFGRPSPAASAQAEHKATEAVDLGRSDQLPRPLVQHSPSRRTHVPSTPVSNPVNTHLYTSTPTRKRRLSRLLPVIHEASPASDPAPDPVPGDVPHVSAGPAKKRRIMKIHRKPSIPSGPVLNAAWPRKPGDDVDTPQWVLKCIEPALLLSGATQVYDPFYGSGAASSCWAHLGWKCLHPSVDFFDKSLRPRLVSPCDHLLVSQPPASLLPRLFKSDLRLLPRWAILVPSSFCLQLDVHAVGELSSIAIAKPVSLCMRGVPVRSKRMTWLVKGIKLPHHSLYTTKGHCYWTMGRGDVLTGAQLAGQSPRATVPAAPAPVLAGLAALRSELHELCRFFTSGAATVSDAHSAALTMLAKLRQHSCAPLGVSIVRKLAEAMALGASLSPDVADTVVSCYERLTSTQEPYILRAVIRVLARVASAHPPTLPKCVRIIVGAMVIPETVDKKCISRCRGAVSSLLLDSPAATRSAIVACVLELRKCLCSAPVSARNLLGVWIDTDRTTCVDHGIVQADFDFLKAMLEPGDDEPLGTLVWEDDFDRPPDAPPVDPDASTRKTLSWNCDGVRSGGALEEMLSMLSSSRPDTAFFWETKADAASIIAHSGICPSGLRQRLRGLGYPFVYFYWCTQPRNSSAYSGVMAMSRSRPVSVSFGVGVPRLDREARAVTIRYKNHTAVGAYAPCVGPERPGGVTGRRTSFETAMSSHLSAEIALQPRLVYVGDLNVSPSASDVDLSNITDDSVRDRVLEVQSCERELLQKLTSNLKLTDAYRKVHPDPSNDDHTWRQRPFGRQAVPAKVSPRVPSSQRIDLALVSDACRVHACDVLPWTQASDHRAIVLSERLSAADVNTTCSFGVEEQCARTVLGFGVEERCPADAHPLQSYADSADEVFTHLCWTLLGNVDCVRVESPLVGLEPGPESPILPCSSAATHDSSGRPTCDEDERRTDTDGGDRCKDLLRFVAEATHRHARVPVTRHRFCGRYVASVLNDTGAELNLISEAFFRKLGVSREQLLQHTPRFQYANGKIGGPDGMVQLTWDVCEGVRDTSFFWIVPECPYDVILGSAYFEARKSVFDFGAKTLSSCIDGCDASYDFGIVEADLPDAAACLYASDNISIQPGHHRLVPVASSARCAIPRGTWGTVQPRPDNGSHGFMVARGITTLSRGDNWVQVANMSSDAILVRRGTPLADFHRQDRSAFDAIDIDLDDIVADASTDGGAACSASAVPAAQPSPEEDKVRASQLRQRLDEVFSETKLKEVTFGDELVRGEHFDEVRALMDEYAHLWDKPSFDGTAAKHDTTCKIVLEGTPNFRARVRSVNPTVRKQITDEVEAQRKMGIIEPSSSPYSSTVLLVPKSDGSVRFCINYRPLNAITKRDGYLMPRVDDSLAALKGSNFFSSLDLSSAFWQIPMDEASKDLTTFATPDGVWRYNRMPFGLVNGPAVFSRFIDGVLSDLKWSVCLVYMDDVLVHTRTMGEHVAALRAIFGRIDAHGLRFKAKKCFICVDSVKFLGHVVSKAGISPDPDKTKAIRQMPVPRSKDAMRSALGLFGYYRKFVNGYSKIAHPIVEALKQHVALQHDKSTGDVIWGDTILGAFETLRGHLLDSPILGHPDWSTPFEVHTDACKHGLGAVLCQRTADKSERVIAYASRSLTDSERKYSVHEWECLAVLWACQLWHGMYLYGARFKVLTDNEAIKWLMSTTTSGKSAMRLDKWIISMMDLDFDVVHRKGSRHGNADGLSRNCLSSACPYNLEPSEPLYGVPAPVLCPVAVRPSNIACAACAGGSCCAASLSDFSHHQHEPVVAAALPYFPPRDVDAWDRPTWSKLQRADAKLSPLFGRLEKGEVIPGVSIAGDGVLVNTIKPTSAVSHDRRDQDRLVVPDSLKAFVLWRHHGLPLAGHHGRKRVYESISRRFWWKGMWKTVRDWVRACDMCSRRKFGRPHRNGEPRSILCSYPFEMVSIDLLGPLPETLSGNTYLLTMLDCFTRWCILVPVKDTTAATVCSALFTHLLTVHGAPSRILSDRGRQLIGAGVTRLCKIWGIKKIATTGHQPQSNPVERFHRYLNSSLFCLHGRFGADWDAYVDAVAFTYRVSVNDTTGYSPFKLTYGREPVQPDDLLFLPSDSSVAPALDPSEYASRMGTILAVAYKDAYDRQLAQTERNAILRQEHSLTVEFFPGQLVFYYQPNNSDAGPSSSTAADAGEGDIADVSDTVRVPNRLRSDWTGPHEVLRRSKNSPNVYVIRHNSTASEISVNVNRLRLHERWSDTVDSTSRDPLSSEPESSAEWKVRGVPEVGDLFAFPLSNDDFPFGVGKLLERRSDDSLHFQWLSNPSENIRGTYRLGWIDSRDNKWTYGPKPPTSGRRYYGPFTDTDVSTRITDDTVVVHGFTIDARGHLPLAVQRILHSAPTVDWEMPTI